MKTSEKNQMISLHDVTKAHDRLIKAQDKYSIDPRTSLPALLALSFLIDQMRGNNDVEEKIFGGGQ